MSPYRVRHEDLPDDSLLVVRGGDLDVVGLRADALAALARFGEAGLSVFAAEDEAAVDELAQGRLAPFAVLIVMRAGVLRRAGLELRPTFRRPHYTVMLPHLDEDLQRLIGCDNDRRTNPYWQGED